MTEAKPVQRFNCRDGILSISLPNWGMKIRWDSRPYAEERAKPQDWRLSWPEFRIILPADGALASRSCVVDVPVDAPDEATARQKKEAFDAFRRVIPDNLAAHVERFGSHQWRLLSGMAVSPALVDLASSNPALAYCLANNDQFGAAPPVKAQREAVARSRLKQREILTWLFFPGTEAMVRLFRKLDPRDVSPLMLKMLRSMADREPQTLSLLAHHRLVTADMLELAAHPKLKTLLTPKLLCRLAEDQAAGQESSTDLLLDALYLLANPRADRRTNTADRVARVRELSASLHRQFERQRRQRQAEAAARQELARRRQEEAAREARKREEARLRALPFPPPPVPGTPNIVPLTSAYDLAQEGQEQQNCAGSYLNQVVRGHTYIYKVLMPERATLELVRTRDGTWMRGQLKRRGNKPTQRTTAAVVDQWLRERRTSSRGDVEAES